MAYESLGDSVDLIILTIEEGLLLIESSNHRDTSHRLMILRL